MKQTAENHEAARAFHRELGHQLFLCRCERKLSLSQVARRTGCTVDELKLLETGWGSRKRLWKILELFKIYKKQVYIEVKDLPVEG